jgi:hypothetical protein
MGRVEGAARISQACVGGMLGVLAAVALASVARPARAAPTVAPTVATAADESAAAGPAAERSVEVSADPSAHPSAYQLGRGLRLGDSGLTLGGYLTAEGARPEGGSTQWRASHASLFLWWEPTERIKAFAELDQQNVLVRQRGFNDPEARDSYQRRVSLERLHLEWTANDALQLRGGKFLTPVGRWNLVHADPLVWTTSRPLLTRSAYPHNVTGLMAAGQPGIGGVAVQYAVYASNGTEWDRDPGQDPFSSVRGGRLVVVPLAGGVEIGASYARYRQVGSQGDLRQLLGLDAFWSRNGWELSAEWLQTRNDRPAPPADPGPGATGSPGGPTGNPTGNPSGTPPGGQTGSAPGGSSPGGTGPQPPRTDRPGMRREPQGLPTRGAYAQVVAPLGAQVFAVARVEQIRDALSDAALRQYTLGLAWRPWPAVSLKLEHQWSRFAGQPAPRGVLGSVSVLF